MRRYRPNAVNRKSIPCSALANLKPNLTKAQLRHSQCELVTKAGNRQKNEFVTCLARFAGKQAWRIFAPADPAYQVARRRLMHTARFIAGVFAVLVCGCATPPSIPKASDEFGISAGSRS